MRIAGICFTENGSLLAAKLKKAWPDSTWAAPDSRQGTLSEWTEARFADSDALVFLGAAGIAVRAIAPFVKDKKTDPAVIVIDEQGCFCIPILSGHIGGANALAEEAAGILGATAVLTTATDRQGKFAVDVFATKNELAISDMELAKRVSATIVNGGEVPFFSEFPVKGERPDGLREVTSPDDLLSDGDAPVVYLGVSVADDHVLHLIPRALVLGIGCRRGTAAEEIASFADRVLAENGLLPQAVAGVATIDKKLDEEGLLALCKERGWPLSGYTAEELAEARGDFTASDFVEETVGVNNVCERSAVFAGGELIVKKQSGGGITCAVARLNKEFTF